MKAVLRIVPVLLTVLFVAVGASIPLVSSLIVDRQLDSETKRWDDVSVSLVLSQDSDITQTLELFRSDRSQVRLTEGENLSAQDAMGAAMKAASALSLAAPAQEDMSATPTLFASSGSSVSSCIFWCCEWGEGEQRSVLWIDDRTGLMVAFDGWVGPSELYAAESPFHEAVFSVLEYCQAQYPIDSVEYEYDSALVENESSSAFVDAAYDRFVSYVVVLSRTVDGRVDECALPLLLDGERLSFNI